MLTESNRMLLKDMETQHQHRVCISEQLYMAEALPRRRTFGWSHIAQIAIIHLDFLLARRTLVLIAFFLADSIAIWISVY